MHAGCIYYYIYNSIYTWSRQLIHVLSALEEDQQLIVVYGVPFVSKFTFTRHTEFRGEFNS